jgi:hypothetical protein
MTKETIIERLLDQGHITINWADLILNRKEYYVDRITELHTDGNVNTVEAICLLNSNPTQIINKYLPGPPLATHNPFEPGKTGDPHWQAPDIYGRTTYTGPADRYGIPLETTGDTNTSNTEQPKPKVHQFYNQDIT